MSDMPRQTLYNLIATYGLALCEDPRRCENLLRDLCGAYRREIHILVSALKEGIVADLLASQADIPIEILLTLLAQRLYDNLGLAKEFARWGVESWALALGKVTATACTTLAVTPRDTASALHATPSFTSLSLIELVERLSEAMDTAMANGANAQQVQVESPQGRLPTVARPAVRRPAVRVKGTYAALAKAVSQVLVVAQQGRGQYTSIAEAIQYAPAGARIVVRPGVYREGLVLDKPLEILGDGPVHTIVIEHAAAAGVQMRTDVAVVRGLTIRMRSGLQTSQCFAVDITQGRLVLEDCDVTSDSLSCVAIHGPTADPLIRRCRIHDGRESGIFVYAHAGGTVEDCEIFGNALSNVVIKQGSNPLIRRCQIHDGRASGIFVYGNTRGTVEDCDIFGNMLSGTAIKQGGDPLIRRCQIHDGKGSGVFVYENGVGKIQDCDIFGNALSGIAIKQGGSPTIRRCRVNRNAHQGIQVYEGGAGTVEHCDLTANTRQAWYIDEVSRVRRRSNIV